MLACLPTLYLLAFTVRSVAIEGGTSVVKTYEALQYAHFAAVESHGAWAVDMRGEVTPAPAPTSVVPVAGTARPKPNPNQVAVLSRTYLTACLLA